MSNYPIIVPDKKSIKNNFDNFTVIVEKLFSQLFDYCEIKK